MKVFYNAHFYDTNAVALGVKNGKIEKIFYKMPKLTDAELIDLKSRYVYPGFIDTHTHSFEGGLYALSVNLENVKNLNDVFELLSTAKPIGGKIFAYHFDESTILEKRFPTIDELDKIFPDIPVLLKRVDGHSCVINSFAAKMIPWQKKLPANFNGYLNAELNNIANYWFHKNIDKQGVLNAYQKAAEIALSQGITTVHTMVGDADKDDVHYELLQSHLSDFPIEFILYPQITDVDRALELGAKRVGGCILADGSFGSHTAALLEPYSDMPQTKGILYKSDEFWEKTITKAHNNNLQFAIHAIGDAAITQILNIYEKLQSKNPKDLRHEIIHNELTSDKMLDTMAKYNISAVMQPMFDRLWAGEGGLYETRLGKERTKRTTRLASILQRGILLTGGSDWYITDLNALKGIDAATKIHNPNERIDVKDAIKIYTENAAKLSFDENRLGKIKEGYQADFAVLKENILTSKNIANIKVYATVKKGEISYI